jgi:hypothetical protein
VNIPALEGLCGSCIEKVKNMEKWRKKVLGRLDTTLILFELVLSVIFIPVGYLTGNMYFRGVGVGLMIAWVTSAIAYLYKKNVKS